MHMSSKLIIVAIVTWFIFMVLAIINAGIRNEVYKPRVGDLAAHQISTVIFMVVVLGMTYLVFRFSNIRISDVETVYLGVIWLVITVLFELIAGHYAFGNSWEKLLADYNILKGRIWILVLLTILISPYIANKLH